MIIFSPYDERIPIEVRIPYLRDVSSFPKSGTKRPISYLITLN